MPGNDRSNGHQVNGSVSNENGSVLFMLPRLGRADDDDDDDPPDEHSSKLPRRLSYAN